MKIENHWLIGELPTDKVKIDKTTNYQYQIIPKYLIIHYTAGDTAKGAINWFKETPKGKNPDKICAHIVIDLDGTIIQMAPFNTRCNHAGYSNWDGKTGMNEYSIGIEIVNAGYCEKLEDGSFRRKISDDQLKYNTYPASFGTNKIIKLKHKHKFWKSKDNQYWFKFAPEQIEAICNLSKLLFETYGLTFVVGHDDISVARKPDPGPAFPWDEFKQNIFGKTNQTGNVFLVQSKDGFANFRAKADITGTFIRELKNGYEVGLIDTFGSWSKVYLVNDINDVTKKMDGKNHSIKIEGWIHSSLLIKKQ
jgi:N-acetylmuramoyl-L-alanine amidase